MKYLKLWENFKNDTENVTFNNLEYIKRTIPSDTHIDITDSKLEYNNELIIKIYSDRIETDRDEYLLDDIDETTIDELIFEVEDWEIENEKTYKRAGIDDDDKSWNNGEEDEDEDWKNDHLRDEDW
jgi:hypothetical protein